MRWSTGRLQRTQEGVKPIGNQQNHKRSVKSGGGWGELCFVPKAIYPPYLLNCWTYGYAKDELDDQCGM